MFLLLSLLLFTSSLISEADMDPMDCAGCALMDVFQHLQIVAAPELIIIKRKWKIFRDISPPQNVHFSTVQLKDNQIHQGGNIISMFRPNIRIIKADVWTEVPAFGSTGFSATSTLDWHRHSSSRAHFHYLYSKFMENSPSER